MRTVETNVIDHEEQTVFDCIVQKWLVSLRRNIIVTVFRTTRRTSAGARIYKRESSQGRGPLISDFWGEMGNNY